jgi:predicted N-acyltransferase
MSEADTGQNGARTLETIESIGDIAKEAWDAMEGASRASNVPYNPFVSHAFLSALEDSGSAEPDTGWIGSHLILRDSNGVVEAALPAYLKMHSYGEYVFDHAWADAYERAGGRYYPKLQSSIPFTPASAPKLLTRGQESGAQALLAEGAKAVVDKLGLSSAHITFVSDAEAQLLEAHDFLTRHDQQFHWYNDGYASFADFAAALASRKRKQIRKERREALANGIQIEWLSGSDLEGRALGRVLRLLPGHWRAQMGSALPHPFVLLADRRAHGRGYCADNGQTRGPLCCWCAQLQRHRRAVWAQLGMHGASPVFAF